MVQQAKQRLAVRVAQRAALLHLLDGSRHVVAARQRCLHKLAATSADEQPRRLAGEWLRRRSPLMRPPESYAASGTHADARTSWATGAAAPWASCSMRDARDARERLLMLSRQPCALHNVVARRDAATVARLLRPGTARRKLQRDVAAAAAQAHERGPASACTVACRGVVGTVAVGSAC